MSVTVRSSVIPDVLSSITPLPEYYVDRSKRPQGEKAEPPTLDYLQGLETEMRRQYADDDEQIIRTRQVRTLKRPVDMPKRFRLVDVEVRDPTVADEIQRTVATLSINPPKLTIKSGDSQAEQENAAKRKHWTEEVMRVCGARETGRSAFVDCVDQCVGDGGAWLKVVLSPDLWEKRYALDLADFANDDGDGYSDESLANFGKATENAKKQSGPPFAISCPDVLTVYPVWYGDQLGEVLEVQSRPMHSTFRQYRLTRGADNRILYSEEVGQATSTVNQRLYPMYAKPIKVYEHWDRNFCFPGDTQVSSESDIVSSSKRWYEGDVVKVRTAGGRQLTGTPNHAVLTERGWVTLAKVVKGDRVIGRALSQVAVVSDPNKQYGNIAIEQAHEALAITGRGERRSGSRLDFHGDGQDSKVDVVTANRHLRDRVKAARAQPAQENVLVSSGQVTVLGIRQGAVVNLGVQGNAPEDGLAGLFGAAKPLVGIPIGAIQDSGRARISPSNTVSGEQSENGAVVALQFARDTRGRFPAEIASNDLGIIDAESLLSFLCMAKGGSQARCFRQGPQGDARIDQSPFDASSTQPDDLGDELQRLPFDGVETDEIVEIDREFFAGHVYNLETQNHWYYANNIIVHNCTMAVADKYSKTDTSPNGKVVKQWRHGYGRPPYFFAPGLMMGWFANKKVGWGVSESKRWLVEYRSFLWTLHAQVCARDAMNPIFREVPADSAPVMGIDGRPRDKEVWQPGDIINGRPGEKLTPIEFPDVAESLQEQIKLVGEAISMLTSPRVNANIGEGVEGAGFAINQQLEEARTRHDPFAQSIENAWTEATRFVWWLVINKVNETVWVYQNGANSGWLSAGPKDLDSTVGISWRLDPAMASAKLIESRYWNERVAAGTASKDMAIEALGDSPSEVRLGQTLDRMRASPWFQKFQDQKVLQRLGRGDILNQAATAANLVQTGQFPSGIPPVGVPGQSGPPAMGAQSGPPDMGQLAVAPGGLPPPQPMPVPPGGISGAGPGLVVPNASAAPMAQGIGH